MPSLTTAQKGQPVSSAQASVKTFSIDDYFFRSLTLDLKRAELPLEMPQLSTEQKETLLVTPPETAYSPPPITPETETKIQPLQPKTTAKEKKHKESLAKIEAEKRTKITAINQHKAKEFYKQGKTYYRNHQFERALQFFQESLKLDTVLKKAAKYIVKSQANLDKIQKQRQKELEKIQKETIQQTAKQVQEETRAQLTQELELAQRQAESAIRTEIQKLQTTIQDLRQQREAILKQQAQEEQTLKQAQIEKARIEAKIQTEQKIKEQIEQQKQQQLSQIYQQTEQKAAPQLEQLKQQLTEQQELLQQAQAQKQITEEQNQQIQALTKEKEDQLEKLQSQDIIPTRPLEPTEPPITEFKPIMGRDLSEALTKPLKPAPETSAIPSSVITPPAVLSPITQLPIEPQPATPSIQPDVKIPTSPSTPPPLPLASTKIGSKYTRAQTLIEPARKLFSLKKVFIGLSSLVGISLIGFFVYWLALRPAPLTPSAPPQKEPALVVRFNKPLKQTSGWSKLLTILMPRVLSLSLENYQIDPAADFDTLIKQEFFYLDFNSFNLDNLNGVLILNLQDKAKAEVLLEKIKGRQKDQVFLENYHKYDIIKCHNQYWVLVDLFNLHYLLFSQNLESLKLTLDYYQKQDLNFVESLEDKVKLTPLLTGTTINVWTNDKNPQISIKQVLAQTDLKLPWLVSENLNHYFTITLLNTSENQPSEPRTAVIFSFDNFDKINQAMLAWEKTMSHETGFLFWGLKPTMPTTLNFQGIIYKNMVIRFLKMPNADLGIYYGLSKKHLVLTNSQRNATMILDQLNP